MRNVWVHTDIFGRSEHSSETLKRTGSFSKEKNLFSRRLYSFALHLISLPCRRNNWDIKKPYLWFYWVFGSILKGYSGCTLSPARLRREALWSCVQSWPLPAPEQKLHRIEAKSRGGPPPSTHTTPPLHQMHFLGGCAAFPSLPAADKCVLFSFLTRVLQIHLNRGGGHSLAGPLTLWKEEKPLKC